MLKQKLAPKHQRLIRQCYPGGRSPDKRPNASELSYLLYYVSTRRAKLSKVGPFLEKLAKSYVYRSRSGNIQVTLDIVKSIIEKCPEDLNLFAINVVNILLAVLNSADLSLCQQSAEVFRVFCAAHDQKLLNYDSGYNDLFHSLLSKFITLASSPKGPNTVQWTKMGIDSSEAIASAHGILSTWTGFHEIKNIVPFLMATLYRDDTNVGKLISLARDLDKQVAESQPRLSDVIDTDRPNLNRDHKSRQNEDTDDGSPAQLEMAQVQKDTLRTLKHLLDGQGMAAAQLVETIQAIVKYELDKQCDLLWSVELLQILAGWTPVQLRFEILSALSDKMVGLKTEKPANQLYIAQLLCSLISYSVNMIGLSVIDFVRTLLIHQHLIITSSNLKYHYRTVEQPAAEPPNSESSQLVDAIRDTIASLAIHIYYADQVSDMISEILSRCYARFGGTAAVDESITGASAITGTTQAGSSDDSRSVIDHNVSISDLQTVRKILQVAATSNATSSINPLRVLEWDGSFLLLASDNLEVRKAYIYALIDFIKNPLSETDRKRARSTDTFAGQHVLFSISSQAASSISATAQPEISLLVALNHLFAALVKGYGPRGGAAVISSSATLYEHATESGSVIVASLAISAILEAANQLKIAPLSQIAEKIIDDRKQDHAFLDRFVEPLSFSLEEDLERPSLSQAAPSEVNHKKYLFSREDLTKSVDSQSVILDALNNPHSAAITGANVAKVSMLSLNGGESRNDGRSPQRHASPDIDIKKARSLNQLRVPAYAGTINSNHSSAHLYPVGSNERNVSGARPKTFHSTASTAPRISDLKRAASSRIPGLPLTDKRLVVTSRSSISVSSLAGEKVGTVNDDTELNLSTFLTNLSINGSGGRVAHV